MSEENCEICGTRIHSITVRSFGGHRWCISCGDNLMLPALHRFVDGFTNAVLKAKKNKEDVALYSHFESVKLVERTYKDDFADAVREGKVDLRDIHPDDTSFDP